MQKQVRDLRNRIRNFETLEILCHLASNKVHIRESQDWVQELEEPFLTMGPGEEPGWVEEQWERGLWLGVVFKEVL